MKHLILGLFLLSAIGCSKKESKPLELPTHLPMKVTKLQSVPVDKVVFENTGPNTSATDKPYIRVTVITKTQDITSDFSVVSGNENCVAQELKVENIVDPTARAAYDAIFVRTKLDFYPEQPVVLEKAPANEVVNLHIHFTGVEQAETFDMHDPIAYTPGVTKIINTRDELVSFFFSYIDTLEAQGKIKTACP